MKQSDYYKEKSTSNNQIKSQELISTVDTYQNDINTTNAKLIQHDTKYAQSIILLKKYQSQVKNKDKSIQSIINKINNQQSNLLIDDQLKYHNESENNLNDIVNSNNCLAAQTLHLKKEVSN